MATQPLPIITEQGYLELDRAARYKSEFVDGAVYAMSGGTLRHSSLAARLIGYFSRQLDGKKCFVLTSDARIRTPKSGSYFYPDLSIICGEPEAYKDDKDLLVNPTVIVEVLSPSTSDYDHGKKFMHYREIPTLQDYLLVHTEEILVEQYTRQSDGMWLLSDHPGPDAIVSLSSINCALHPGPIYEGAIR